MEIGVLNFDEVHNDLTRKIIHVDMDAFFASVEIRDNPKLANKPVIIAKHPNLTHGRGVVSTCNYIARSFGVHSAMSAKQAYELCPNGVFLPGNYTKYQSVSNQIKQIFSRYTDKIEMLSIDEAFLDVTTNFIHSKSAIYIAKCIQRDIKKELNLTCSAGVSYNKFLAKVASDMKKPAGLTVILPEEAKEFLKNLPIKKFYGVGRKSLEKLKMLNIEKGEDLLHYNALELINQFGRLGFMMLQRVHGIDNSKVQPNRQRKSIGKESTYYPELVTIEDVTIAIRNHCYKIEDSLNKRQLYGNLITLKLRYSNFETKTHQKKIDKYINQSEDIFQEAIDLYEEFGIIDAPIRLLGVSISGLSKNIKIEQLV